jgi:hypothetical protein
MCAVLVKCQKHAFSFGFTFKTKGLSFLPAAAIFFVPTQFCVRQFAIMIISTALQQRQN